VLWTHTYLYMHVFYKITTVLSSYGEHPSTKPDKFILRNLFCSHIYLPSQSIDEETWKEGTPIVISKPTGYSVEQQNECKWETGNEAVMTYFPVLSPRKDYGNPCKPLSITGLHAEIQTWDIPYMKPKFQYYCVHCFYVNSVKVTEMVKY
jgi:hypothetical protein